MTFCSLEQEVSKKQRLFAIQTRTIPGTGHKPTPTARFRSIFFFANTRNRPEPYTTAHFAPDSELEISKNL